MLTIWELTNWVGILVLSFLFFVQVVLRVIKHYIHVPIPAFATPLIDNPFRRRFIQKPETIADRMHIEPGMTVLEIGPGKGSYTLAVAKRVQPGGKVYAVDIQEAVIRKLEQRLRRELVDNVFARAIRRNTEETTPVNKFRRFSKDNPEPKGVTPMNHGLPSPSWAASRSMLGCFSLV